MDISKYDPRMDIGKYDPTRMDISKYHPTMDRSMFNVKMNSRGFSGVIKNL